MGKSPPSMYVRSDPPPVDRELNWLCKFKFSMIGSVSPPPIIEKQLCSAIIFANSIVPLSKGSFSTYPRGPFQNIAADLLIIDLICSRLFSPTSKIISFLLILLTSIFLGFDSDSQDRSIGNIILDEKSELNIFFASLTRYP